MSERPSPENDAPGWSMGCGHFDSFGDPNHDCSTWGDGDSWREPPEGWHTFGTHVDEPVRLEFSTETDDGGMPLWERVIPPGPSPENDAGVWRWLRRYFSWYFRTLFDFPTRRPYPATRDIPPGTSD